MIRWIGQMTCVPLKIKAETSNENSTKNKDPIVNTQLDNKQLRFMAVQE